MTDDDNTPRIRRGPRVMSDDERALAGRRRRAQSYPLGIPVAPDRELTDPVLLLERGLLPEEQEIVQRSCRDGGEPVPYAQFAKLVHRQHEQERARRKRDTDRVREIEELRQAVSPEVVERIDRRLTTTEKTLRAARRLVIAAVIAVAGSAGVLAKALLDGAEARGAATERLKQIELRIERLYDDIHELRINRRSEIKTNTSFTAQGPLP